MSASHTPAPGATTRSEVFLQLLVDFGFDFFTGVPCSYFGRLIHVLESDARLGYVSAVREDSALGLAAGAYLGGRRPVVFMQNSGFAASLGVLASLHAMYNLPVLLVITWRGQDPDDAPEHLAIGSRMPALLDVLEIPRSIFDAARVREQLAGLVDVMERTRKPVALVLPRRALD